MGPSSPEKSAGFYLREGDAFAGQGRWSQAQASFAMAMKLAPNASLTWLSYALSCFPLQLFGPAGSAIEDALHYAIPIPDTAEIRQGLEAYELRDWAEAVRWFEAALAKDALGHLVTAKNMEEAGATNVGSQGS
jgi:tetratricopeptide (TPR) repeat protein